MSVFFALRSTRIINLIGMVAVLLGLSAPALPQSSPSNSDEQFAEILAQMTILNEKIDALSGIGGAGPCAVPPVWGKKFPGPERFVAVLDETAFCDQETGMVWEGSPDTNTRTWTDAITHCAQRNVGGRKGWVLPMQEQLATLVLMDADNNTGLALPPGHPFQNVPLDASYWAATTWTTDPTLAWIVDFSTGTVDINHKSFNSYSWCVRGGGQSFDGNTHETSH
jgi:hypothetical protein